MTRDRWILTTAWALIVTAGAAGLYKISRLPTRDAEIEAQCQRLKREMAHGKLMPAPLDDSLVRFMRQWGSFNAEGKRPHPLSTMFLTRSAVKVVPPVTVDVPVQPWLATPTVKASLDGIALAWTLSRGHVPMGPNERAKDVAPTGIRIEKNDGRGWKEVAKLDAKAASWKDVETAARTLYAYRVKLDAPEKARAAADGGEAEARTPSDRRVRLTGGDTKVAIVKVETYDRKSGRWLGKDATVRPGQSMGGWTLKGLAFKGFVLVATAVDEDGRVVELTTRE